MLKITEIQEMIFDFETGIYETVLYIQPATLDEIKEIGVTKLGCSDDYIVTIPYYNFNKLHHNTIYYIDKEDRNKHLEELFNHAMDVYEDDIEYHKDHIRQLHCLIDDLDQYMKGNL